MGAGEKLRAAALKIAQKVPGAPVSLALLTITAVSTDFATSRRDCGNESILIEFGTAYDVRNLSVARSTALLGNYVAGDREFLIPAELVERETLDDPSLFLRYGSEDYAIIRTDEHEIAFGVVLTWLVMGRLRAATRG